MTFGVRMNGGLGPGRFARSSRFVRRGPGTTYRKLQSLKFLLTRDRAAVRAFLREPYPVALSLADRLSVLSEFFAITHAVRGYHTLTEILRVTDRILKRPKPLVVEAGSGTGSSTAKLSIVTKLAGGRLLVFDSFQGIPPNEELLHLRDGRPLTFRAGAFRGRLAAVKDRVARWGAIEVCSFHKGPFAETLPQVLPHMKERPDVVLIDVDLLSSTRTCVEHLFPRLSDRGVMFSQDGHIREVVELFSDASFWRCAVGVEPPALDARPKKLLELHPKRPPLPSTHRP